MIAGRGSNGMSILRKPEARSKGHYGHLGLDFKLFKPLFLSAHYRNLSRGLFSHQGGKMQMQVDQVTDVGDYTF